MEINVNLFYSRNALEDMVKISINKIERKFWMPAIGTVISIKRLSMKGCAVEHYEVVDYKYHIHIYQFHRKKSAWETKDAEKGGIDVTNRELSILREIVNVIDVYDHLENIWLLLCLLGLNNKVCADIVGYTFNIYFLHKSYKLKVMKI